MRGDDQQQEAMFSVLSPEQRVPADHPPRRIREMVDRVLIELSPEFDALYARTGRWAHYSDPNANRVESR